jgi:hypothetical protein
MRFVVWLSTLNPKIMANAVRSIVYGLWFLNLELEFVVYGLWIGS